jgi:serine/threonine protein kinase
MSNHKIPHIPGYKIVKVIGEGGMGIVYLAIQSALDRKVALKVTLPSLAEMDESFTKRFVREAKATAALNHPNIITIFDAGVYENSSYMAMEYIPTGTLADLEDSHLSHEKICELFIGICRGLSAAHNAGFVHRDIKPDNILIDANGNPQVTDFGIVKSLGTQNTAITLAGGTIGTPQYMSPEQIKAEKLDGRSDLYSVGVMMYNLLEGHVPFYDETPSAVYIKHVTTTAPPLSKNNSPYQVIIKKLLRKEPKNRYADALELVQALQDLRASGFKVIENTDPQVSQDVTAVNPDDIPDEDKAIPRIKTKTITGAPTIVAQATFQDDALAYASAHNDKAKIDNKLKAIIAIASLVILVGLYFIVNKISSNGDDSAKLQRLIVKEKRNEEHQTYWDKAKQANSIASYQRYLNKYPQGSYKSEAINQQNLLKQSDKKIETPKLGLEDIVNNVKNSTPKVVVNIGEPSISPDKPEKPVEYVNDKNSVDIPIENNADLPIENNVDTESGVAELNQDIKANDKPPVNEEIVSRQEINNLLVLADADIKVFKLLKPKNNNAYEKLNKILVIDPQNFKAKKRVLEIVRSYLSLSNSSREDNIKTALVYINNAINVRKDYLAKGYDESDFLGVSSLVSMQNLQKTKDNLNEISRKNELAAINKAKQQQIELQKQEEKKKQDDREKELLAANNDKNGSAEDYYKKGLSAYKKKDYLNAENWYLKAASKNHAPSQDKLGSMYFEGRGVKKSVKTALQWYQKAADQKYPKAQDHMGLMYYNGLGVNRNYKKSFDLFRKAAENGFADAQWNLGVMYENGKGVKLDKKRALMWYKKSAIQGNALAIKKLIKEGKAY